MQSLIDFGRLQLEQRWGGILAQELGKEYSVIEEGNPGRTTVWDDPLEGFKRVARVH
jgi:hypothetical protein